MAMLARIFDLQHRVLTMLPGHMKYTLVMVVSVLWMVLGITISTWGWAMIYIYIGEFQHWEPALYYAIASFTTLGYGDIVLSEQWRILGALSAVNGLIVFGLNTAFLIEQILHCRNDRPAASE